MTGDGLAHAMVGPGNPARFQGSPIYRNLSAFSRTTDLTASLYLQKAADGRLIGHKEAQTDRLAGLCWMPIPLLQAAPCDQPHDHRGSYEETDHRGMP
ncbi:hypothetical protein AB0945_35700 [Streptomyces sp. NPDC005474]|uniref:hypothetical protein n=1 Tax=Streptomyces sp. NPDC005474 TaxID=3154878 RepID=UPI00345168F0